MIFVTVGAQMPFDRLVRAVDDWALRRGRTDVFAQIGPSEWTPRNIRWVRFIDPTEYEDCCRRATLIVAHAGTGSILTALHLGKPILLMPRSAALNETRNDHQFATVERFAHVYGVRLARDENELPARLDEVAAGDGPATIGQHASPQLIEAIRDFIAAQAVRKGS